MNIICELPWVAFIAAFIGAVFTIKLISHKLIKP